ncbi:hypothetical protein [Streptomyces natalensis]|uniref:Uncharacterized protein n=1 Tax=Streptomyces natalensis ATCC 27448 TaxID=1240678 RepID=A0A0D7CRV1_9ACTN|nr:hypothetical protein [Streptomyces natalensis]KIZ18137.1 hypothetical protein SNA_08945 [Streptomyces natalensis ATCC 27448]
MLELFLAVLVELLGVPVTAVRVPETDTGDEGGADAGYDDTVCGLEVALTDVSSVEPPRAAPEQQGIADDG